MAYLFRGGLAIVADPRRLAHQHNGIDLDIRYATATLTNVQAI